MKPEAPVTSMGLSVVAKPYSMFLLTNLLINLQSIL
jgi:hypothetical protein